MTEQEKIELHDLREEVRVGFARMEERQEATTAHLEALDARTQFLDGTNDALRHDMMRAVAEVERKPCARHAERLQRLERKVSDEVKALHREGNTDRIELAKLEAERHAREQVLAEIRAATAEATAASDRRWKRIANIFAAIIVALGSAGGYQAIKGDDAPTQRKARVVEVQTQSLVVVDAGVDAPRD